MPAAEVMLDSNVLVYALSDAPPERKKRNTAATLLAEQDFGTSYQVLMETRCCNAKNGQCGSGREGRRVP